MTRFDAVVVGAGPAGSTAARELALAGARVFLADREHFPRYKACGGGIPVRTQGLLPFSIGPVVEDSVSLIDVRYRERLRSTHDSGRPFAHMVMRDRFDQLLLQQAEAAGAEFRPGTRVDAVRAGPGGLSVGAGSFEVQADFVIAADGANSVVGRLAGLGAGVAECAAWELELQVPASRQAGFEGTSMIGLGYRPWGYTWVFPKAGGLSAGIVLPAEQAGTMKARTQRYLDRLGLGNARVKTAQGHKIRFWRGHEPIANQRVLLAGDAAGFADEFTQEGIYYAIQSGQLAAKAVLRAGAGDGDLRWYQEAAATTIAPELRAARLIGYMFYGMLRRLPYPWMFASMHLEHLWRAFFSVQRGTSTYEAELARLPVLPAVAGRMLDRRCD